MSEVWLIANAASAAGFALAEAALKAGAQIVAGAREPARLTVLAARHDGRVLAVPLDLAAEATVYAAIDAAMTAFGRLDVVVNMVDKVEALPVAEMDDATLRKQFERHFFGVVGLAHAVLPILHEQGGGRIVHVALRDHDSHPASLAASHAVRGYFEGLAREIAPHGIEVSVIETDRMPIRESGLAAQDARRKSGERGEPAPRGRVVDFPARSAA